MKTRPAKVELDKLRIAREEQVRKQNELLDIELAVKRHEYLPRSEVMAVWAASCLAVRDVINNCKALPENERDELLRLAREVPVEKYLPATDRKDT